MCFQQPNSFPQRSRLFAQGLPGCSRGDVSEIAAACARQGFQLLQGLGRHFFSQKKYRERNFATGFSLHLAQRRWLHAKGPVRGQYNTIVAPFDKIVFSNLISDVYAPAKMGGAPGAQALDHFLGNFCFLRLFCGFDRLPQRCGLSPDPLCCVMPDRLYELLREKKQPVEVAQFGRRRPRHFL